MWPRKRKGMVDDIANFVRSGQAVARKNASQKGGCCRQPGQASALLAHPLRTVLDTVKKANAKHTQCQKQPVFRNSNRV